MRLYSLVLAASLFLSASSVAAGVPGHRRSTFKPPRLHQPVIQPVYPAVAKRAGVQGKVVLNALIGEAGSIERLRYASGPPLLVTAAMSAVMHLRFSPALLNGKHTAAESTVVVKFTLHPQRIVITAPLSTARPVHRPFPPKHEHRSVPKRSRIIHTG